MTVLAAVLAAGGGTRFLGDGAKLHAPFRGRPLAAWAVDAALGAGLDETIVVVGAVDVDVPAGATIVRNERWEDGQATSLQAAVAYGRAQGHRSIVVGLADQPLVPAAAWTAVARHPGPEPVVTATFEGHRRPPVRLDATVWSLLPVSGDEGARALMRERPDLVAEVPCPGEPIDIDTLEDLARWS